MAVKPLSKIAIVGAGLMGSGIAQVAASTGHQVALVDVAKALQAASLKIQDSLARIAKKTNVDNTAQVMCNITMTSEHAKAVGTADLVLEAITESMDAKHELFKKLDALAPPAALFASNTSSLSIAEISSVTSKKRQAQFGGLHFFSPVPMMPLLEVVKAPNTSEATHAALLAWGKAIKKTTITCKDTPGFVVNRLLVPYMMEAIRLVERGDASPEDVDTAMKLGAGYPMGPFELSDFTGLDISANVINGWHKRFPNNPLFKPSQMVNDMITKGTLGRKSGKGFYDYNPKK